MELTRKLKRYAELSEMIKERESLRGELLDLKPGVYGKYLLDVTDCQRTSLAPISAFDDAIGRELLERHRLIKVTEFKTLRVKLLSCARGSRRGST